MPEWDRETRSGHTFSCCRFQSGSETVELSANREYVALEVTDCEGEHSLVQLDWTTACRLLLELRQMVGEYAPLEVALLLAERENDGE